MGDTIVCPLCGGRAQRRYTTVEWTYWVCPERDCGIQGPNYDKDGSGFMRLGANRTPGTVEVPISELEALARFRVVGGTMETIDAVLSHLPPKVDHVAVLRRLAKYSAPHGAEHAALEAAIAALEGSGG